MTFREELEKIRAQIHFKENSIPSIHAGQLTDETITSIINLVDKEVIGEDDYHIDKSFGTERKIVLSHQIHRNELRASQRAIIREEKTS